MREDSVPPDGSCGWLLDCSGFDRGWTNARGSRLTKNEWRIQIEPAFNAAGGRKMTARAHDLQNRIVIESTGWIQRHERSGIGIGVRRTARTHLYHPDGTYLRKDYTARGQLAAVGWDDDENNWWRKLAAYTYLIGQILKWGSSKLAMKKRLSNGHDYTYLPVQEAVGI